MLLLVMTEDCLSAYTPAVEVKLMVLGGSDVVWVR